MDKNRRFNQYCNTLCLQGVLLLCWFFLMDDSYSFKTASEATQMNPFIIFPSVWRKDAFLSVMSKMNFLRLYYNTLVLIIERVVCAVLTATMAGYAFGRLHFKGKNLAFSWYYSR